eukprot:2313634-Rhodomonas_salina.2
MPVDSDSIKAIKEVGERDPRAAAAPQPRLLPLAQNPGPEPESAAWPHMASGVTGHRALTHCNKEKTNVLVSHVLCHRRPPSPTAITPAGRALPGAGARAVTLTVKDNLKTVGSRRLVPGYPGPQYYWYY